MDDFLTLSGKQEPTPKDLLKQVRNSFSIALARSFETATGDANDRWR